METKLDNAEEGAWAICAECGDEYPTARALLGYVNCLDCGQRQAASEIKEKAKRVDVLCHKSGFQYLGDPKAAKRNMLDAGKKTSESMTGSTTIQPKISYKTPKPKASPKKRPRRKIVGFRWVKGERVIQYATN